MSSTGLTLLVLPIVYMLFNDSIPRAPEQAPPPFTACPHAGNRTGKLTTAQDQARFSSSHTMTMGMPFTAASSMSGNSCANSNVAISRSPQSGSTQRTTSSPADWNAAR